MDSLIFQVTSNVLMHYWYAIQCKLYSFVMNKAAERVVTSAIMHVHFIPDNFVKLYPEGHNIAFVTSMNHYPKIWTVLDSDKDYTQCDCPVAERGNICKHIVKCFKMLHPEIQDVFIIRITGTTRGMLEFASTISTLDAFRVGGLVSTCDVEMIKRTSLYLGRKEGRRWRRLRLYSKRY